MKKKTLLMSAVLILAMVVVSVVTVAKEGQEKEVRLPEPAKQLVASMYPSAKIEMVGMEEDGIALYEVNLDNQGKKESVVISEDGKLVSVESEVAAESLPASVAAVISQKAPNAKITKTEKEVKHAVVTLVNLPKPQISYESKVIKDGKEYVIVIDSNGVFVDMKAIEKKEASSQLVSLSDLPATVRATIEKLTAGGEIKKIEKEEQQGVVIYDVEAKVKDKDVEYDVDSNGKILTSEESVPYSSMPSAVQAAVKKYFGSTEGLKASKEVEKSETFYEVEGKKAGSAITLKLSAAGAILEEEK